MRYLRPMAWALAVLAAGAAHGGAKLKIGDESEIDFGFRLQALFIHSDEDRNGDGAWESYDDFRVRRASLRVRGVLNEHFEAFLQTDIGSAGNGSGSGQDDRLIDAYVTAKASPWAQFVMGLNLAPASRQNLTSSGGPMTLDRPGFSYRTLTWGARTVHTFTNRTFVDGASGLTAPVGLRDLGLTIFGTGDVGKTVHLKYYAGAYDGINAAIADTLRFTGRVQVNLWDAERGYTSDATYLGKKKTLAIGASIDTQSDVAVGTAPNTMVDYDWTTVDVFFEWPVGAGAVTAEGAWGELDFGDDAAFLQSQGSGFYVQAGWTVGKWQPWVEYETWDADATTNVGSCDNVRIGVTYLLKGHNANIKVGWEQFSVDVPFSGTTEDSIGSLVLGFFTTY